MKEHPCSRVVLTEMPRGKNELQNLIISEKIKCGKTPQFWNATNNINAYRISHEIIIEKDCSDCDHHWMCCTNKGARVFTIRYTFYTENVYLRKYIFKRYDL